MDPQCAMKSYSKVMLLLLFALCSGVAYADNTLVLGVHPYKASLKLIKAYTPLAEYLSKAIGQSIQVKISRDYHSHIELIGKDKLDIAYMGPASYVDMVERFGEKPILARQAIKGSPTFQGKIITRNNNGIQKLIDLKGKRFAFGDSASTMSHLVPRYMLWESGVTVDQLSGYKFLGSHDNVALAVLGGDYDAGAVKEAVFYKYQSRGLRELATTPALSEHLFVASTRLPKEVVEKLRKALLELHSDPQGKKIMSGIKKGISAYLPAGTSDYDNLRVILKKLKEMGISG